MAVPVTLLDTSALPPREREAAVQEFRERFTQLDALKHACPPESVVTRMRAWELGTLRLDVTECPWLGAELNRYTETEAVSIAAQVSGQTAMVLDGRAAELRIRCGGTIGGIAGSVGIRGRGVI